MAAWTWRGWADPLVDFGRELYVPWRLSEGDVLYRDLTYVNGPLSAYFNAFLFRVFGTGYSTLVGANIAVLVITVFMIHRLIERIADRFTATTSCALLLLVFAFGQYTQFANYNWVSPYSHEMTHGLALAIAVVFALDRWGRVRASRWLVVAGLSLGLSVLTKPETFLAALVGGGICLFPVVVRREWRSVGVFVGLALVPPVVAFGLLSPALGPGGALAGMASAWLTVFEGEVMDLSLYTFYMGIDAPILRLWEMGVVTFYWAIVFGPALVIAAFLKGPRVPVRPTVVAVFLAEIVALILLRGRVSVYAALRPLPLLLGVVGITSAVLVMRRPEERDRWITTLALVGLAFAMIGKMIVLTRVHNLGFGLALPASMIMVVTLVYWLPNLIDRRGGRRVVLQAAALAVLSYLSAEYVTITRSYHAQKSVVVGEGADAFRADSRGAVVNEALALIDSLSPSTFAVIPEGIMLNYLSRKPNPTAYLKYVRFHYVLYGEDAWYDSFCRHPPDVIVFIPRTFEFVGNRFGIDFSEELLAWIEGAYEEVSALSDDEGLAGPGRVMVHTGEGCGGRLAADLEYGDPGRTALTSLRTGPKWYRPVARRGG